MALLALASLLLPGVPVAAQQGDRKIVAIVFDGLRSLPEETLKYYLGIAVGRQLDEAALDRAITQLWQRKLIDDIRVDSEPVAEGVRLRITVKERPTLRSLTYEGLKKVTRQDITERIAKDQIDVREGSGVNLGELARLEAAIEEMYREKGYRFARAQYKLEEISPSERRATFTVDEGDRVRIGRIEFPGAEVFGRWRLRWAMKKTKETGPIVRLLKRDIYNPATFQEDLENLRKVYRSAGYKNMSVGDPVLEVRATNPNAPVAKQKRRLFLSIPVVEDQRWRLGEISIDGNQLFSDENLLRQFKRPRGGWLSSKVLEEGIKNVSEAYRNSGHIYARIEPEIKEREGHLADLTVHVDEGDQYRVGRIEFEGNSTTRDNVLRREFRVQEGTVLNMGAVKNSIYKINQLQFFKLDEEDPVQFQNFDSEKKTVDLVLKGQESDRTELQFAAGYSELDSFFGQVSVRTMNFLGRGESVGVSFQTGRYRDEYNLSYSAPWLFDRPQSFGVQIYKSNLDYTNFYSSDSNLKRASEGVMLSYGRSFGLFQSVSMTYNRSRYDDYRSLTNVDGQLVESRYKANNSSIRPVYAFESRDSRTEPTRGWRFTGSLEYAGGPLGGDNHFLRPEIGFSLYKPVSFRPRTVAAINLEAGWIKELGDRPLPFFERYFLGNEQSVRGFRYRSIVVRDRDGNIVYDESGFPLGGTKFLQANAEFHWLVSGPFRVLAFVDAGGVYGEGRSIDFGALRYSAGLELRIFVPVFGAPLRFIYSTNLDPLPDDSFESFQFSIGSTF